MSLAIISCGNRDLTPLMIGTAAAIHVIILDEHGQRPPPEYRNVTITLVPDYRNCTNATQFEKPREREKRQQPFYRGLKRQSRK